MKRKAIITKVKSGKSNGEPVAQSGTETYHNLNDCEDTLRKYFTDFQIKHAF